MGTTEREQKQKELEEACAKASQPKTYIFETIFRSHDEKIGEEYSAKVYKALPGYVQEAGLKELAWMWSDEIRDNLLDDPTQCSMHLVVLTVSLVNQDTSIDRDGMVLYRLF